MIAALHAEWIKARSTVGSAIAVPLAVVISFALAVASGLSTRQALDTDRSLVRPDFDPVDAGFYPVLYGNLAFVVFAVLVVTSEHTTGTIRSSLAAVPRRGLFYTAKLTVVAASALLVGGTTVLGSFLVTEAALGRYGAGLSDPGATRAVLGGVAFVVLLNLFAAAVAVLLRGTALALGILMPLFFAVSPLLTGIAGTRPVARFLPDQAGMQAMRAATGAGELTPSQGLLVLLAWTVVVTACGYWAIRRRDA